MKRRRTTIIENRTHDIKIAAAPCLTSQIDVLSCRPLFVREIPESGLHAPRIVPSDEFIQVACWAAVELKAALGIKTKVGLTLTKLWWVARFGQAESPFAGHRVGCVVTMPVIGDLFPNMRVVHTTIGRHYAALVRAGLVVREPQTLGVTFSCRVGVSFSPDALAAIELALANAMARLPQSTGGLHV